MQIYFPNRFSFNFSRTTVFFFFSSFCIHFIRNYTDESPRKNWQNSASILRIKPGSCLQIVITFSIVRDELTLIKAVQVPDREKFYIGTLQPPPPPPRDMESFIEPENYYYYYYFSYGRIYSNLTIRLCLKFLYKSID